MERSLIFLQNNSAVKEGGAVYMIQAQDGFLVEDSMFLYNTAGKDSTIVVNKADWFIIKNSIFMNNQGAQGSAINIISESNGTIKNSIFKNNTSSDSKAVQDLYLTINEGMFVLDTAFLARDVNHSSQEGDGEEIHAMTCDGKERTHVTAGRCFEMINTTQG